MNDWLKPNEEERILKNMVECIMDDLDNFYFDELIMKNIKKNYSSFSRKFLKNTVFFHLDLIFQTKRTL